MIAFFSCTKDSPNSCETSMNLKASNLTPVVGEDFIISSSIGKDNDLHYWSGPGFAQSNNSNTLSFNSAKYSNRGWYYCSKENTECKTILKDSYLLMLN